MTAVEFEKEARDILEYYNRELGMSFEGKETIPGYYVDGIKAVDWMRANNIPSWKELEWPGFFVRHIAQDYFQNNPQYGLHPETDRKKYRLRGKYLWDIRFHNVESGNEIILTNAVDFEQTVIQNNGIGIVVLFAAVNADTTDEFRELNLPLRSLIPIDSISFLKKSSNFTRLL